jgi:hypothetical protein
MYRYSVNRLDVCIYPDQGSGPVRARPGPWPLVASLRVSNHFNLVNLAQLHFDKPPYLMVAMLTVHWGERCPLMNHPACYVSVCDRDTVTLRQEDAFRFPAASDAVTRMRT